MTMNRAGRQRVVAAAAGHQSSVIELALDAQNGCGGQSPERSLAAEASLVSPHERSLIVLRATAGVARQCAAAAWSSSRAARTSAAWPSGLTFGQARAIRPSGSTRNVVRAVPQ